MLKLNNSIVRNRLVALTSMEYENHEITYKDYLKKMLFAEIKYFDDDEFQSRSTDQQFRWEEYITGTLEELTPQEFTQVFPIDKEYNNWKFDTRGYQDAIEEINKIGWDTEIRDGFEFLMNYWNHNTMIAVVNMMTAISHKRREYTGTGMIDDFFGTNFGY